MGERDQQPRDVLPPLFGGDPVSRPVLPGPACPKDVPTDVWDAVLAYRPKTPLPVEWADVRPFVLGIVARLAPTTWTSASQSMWLLAHYTAWATSQGLPQDVEVVLHPDRVDFYATTVLAGTPTAGTYRSRLAKIGREVTRRAPWDTLRSVSYKRSLRAPYDRDEMALFEHLETQQPCTATTRTFTGIFRLCAGAGTSPGESARVTAADLFRADGLLWVRIGGDLARDVPVAVRHADRLAWLADRYPDGPLLGINPDAKNGLADALKRLRLDRHHSGLSPQRLRTTWLTNRLAAGVPIPDLLAFSGLTSTGWIADLIDYLPDGPDGVAALAVTDP